MQHAIPLPDLGNIIPLFDMALQEDIGVMGIKGDATSMALFAESDKAVAQVMARQPIIACGVALAGLLASRLDGDIMLKPLVADGAACDGEMMIIKGSARSVMAIERTMLNMLQHLSGIATLTRHYVDAIAGTGAILLDTRKTTPSWRALEKYATRCGGAKNHRMGLYDAMMIKDNHIALCDGDIQAAVAKARDYALHLPLIVECDALLQVEAALQARPDRILLDNMAPAMLREAVQMVAKRIPLEASGGVTLATIREIAETGVDYISVGAITHSARAVDIGLDVTIL